VGSLTTTKKTPATTVEVKGREKSEDKEIREETKDFGERGSGVGGGN
jgi:hypothetical protein